MLSVTMSHSQLPHHVDDAKRSIRHPDSAWHLLEQQTDAITRLRFSPPGRLASGLYDHDVCFSNRQHTAASGG